MIWRNTPERYGAVAAGLHWLIALAVITMLGLGLYMVRQEPSSAMLKLYYWHKSLGVTVLALVAVRVLWRLLNIQPAPLQGHKKWEKALARIIHFLLYACLFALPLSGWVMSSAKNFPVSVFGLFVLPNPVPENEAMAKVAAQFHEAVAYMLIGIVVLHVAGALKHHVVDRDGTLRRMIPGARLALAVLALALGGYAYAQDAASLPSWTIDRSQSSITFEGTQMGAPFKGAFGQFDGTILFDPDRLADSRVTMIVNVASATTHSADRDKYILLPVWLGGESFPESVFKSEIIEKTAENQYLAKGNLTIKGVTLPVDVPFALVFKDNDSGLRIAEMKGFFTIERLAYKVGEGEWEDISMVGNPVTVRVTLVAAEAAP